ncbi:MAG: hypothetical protein ACTHN5_18420 [Phycisphaerae bacterium]
MVSRSSILEHVIEPEKGNLSADLARYLLTLNFPRSDQERYEALAEKAQLGVLTPEEKSDLDDFLNVNDFLTIIQAKARASLS